MFPVWPLNSFITSSYFQFHIFISLSVPHEIISFSEIEAISLMCFPSCALNIFGFTNSIYQIIKYEIFIYKNIIFLMRFKKLHLLGTLLRFHLFSSKPEFNHHYHKKQFLIYLFYKFCWHFLNGQLDFLQQMPNQYSKFLSIYPKNLKDISINLNNKFKD